MEISSCVALVCLRVISLLAYDAWGADRPWWMTAASTVQIGCAAFLLIFAVTFKQLDVGASCS
jgi:hypothetical protein